MTRRKIDMDAIKRVAQRMIEDWTPDRFVKHTYATDTAGKTVLPTSENATKFCFLGEFRHINGYADVELDDFCKVVAQEVRKENLTRYRNPVLVNDRDKNGHEHLISALKGILARD